MINSFKASEQLRVFQICKQIQAAQNELNTVAYGFFKNCLQCCKGICCRNIHINDIVSLLDFVFIFTISPSYVHLVKNLSRKETLFSSDCLFLEDNIGPCVFSRNIKPERCIITFCQNTKSIRKEIRTVQGKFSQLERYLIFRNPLLWFGF